MGNNQYTDLWNTYRPVIVSLIKNGGGQYQLSKDSFSQRGNRNDYSFSLTIVNSVIPVNSGSAVARDLKTVLDASPSFRQYAAGKTVIIRLTSTFALDVRVA